MYGGGGNPELYFTHVQSACIYYIFGCAARAVDARFFNPTPWLRELDWYE